MSGRQGVRCAGTGCGLSRHSILSAIGTSGTKFESERRAAGARCLLAIAGYVRQALPDFVHFER